MSEGVPVVEVSLSVIEPCGIIQFPTKTGASRDRQTLTTRGGFSRDYGSMTALGAIS
jgi:hypothetical protein